MATVPLKCPRCSGSIDASPDEMGFLVCPGCGAKLRSKTPAVVKVQGGAGASPPAPGDIDSVLARLDGPPNPSATLPPGTPLKKIPRPGQPGAPGAPASAPSGPASLEGIFAEIRALRETQEEILRLLRGGGAAPRAAEDSEDPFAALQAPSPAPPPPSVRSRRRKTALLIDDDEGERRKAMAALEKAQVPVKAAVDGNGGLAAIAMEKPDVVVMELDLAGSMSGKDVINMIKATMEWVDNPIVLYTRLAIDQREARTIHGADDVVGKSPKGPEGLVAKVVSVFRKG
ncbi:MAG: response regulator [Acidobacteria bacterium]|nr:response regulator [Acidobacteriota bacterium]